METTTIVHSDHEGPLAELIRKQPPAPADLDSLLPCEKNRQCFDPRPILAPSAFDLAQRLPGRLGRRAPRFGIFDPLTRNGASYYWPRLGKLGTMMHWISDDPVQVWTRLASNRERAITAGIVGGVGAVGCGAVFAFGACPCIAIPIGVASLVGAGIIRLIGFDTPGPRYVATYAGPIPDRIRTRISALSKAGQRPCIVAPAAWELDRFPAVTRHEDPYLVTHCTQGGEAHLHVDAWWNVGRDEVVLHEFITPAPAAEEPKRRGLDFSHLIGERPDASMARLNAQLAQLALQADRPVEPRGLHARGGATDS